MCYYLLVQFKRSAHCEQLHSEGAEFPTPMRCADRQSAVFVCTRIPGNEAFKLWPEQWGEERGVMVT
jgi:hypothetical protein